MRRVGLDVMARALCFLPSHGLFDRCLGLEAGASTAPARKLAGS